MTTPTYAILVDGGFITKTLSIRNKVFPSVSEIVQETARIQVLDFFLGHSFLRIYYYDSPPATDVLYNPVDGTKLDLGITSVARRNAMLLMDLETQPYYAVRRGETVVHGWKIGEAAVKQMLKTPRAPEAGDLVPNIQ